MEVKTDLAINAMTTRLNAGDDDVITNFENMYIRSANRRCINADDNVAGIYDFGIWYFYLRFFPGPS